jgi:type IV pilus assembly protein PilA
MDRLRVASGFTLIELLIAIAIIGVLAVVAIPAYQDFNVRAQVAEALTLTQDAKTGIAESFAQTRIAPRSREEAGLSTAPTDTLGKYVSQVDVQQGRIEVMMGNDAHALIQGKVLALTPYQTSDGSVVWRCGSENAPSGPGVELLGTGTESAAVYSAGDIADVEGGRYLPVSCRPS